MKMLGAGRCFMTGLDVDGPGCDETGEVVEVEVGGEGARRLRPGFDPDCAELVSARSLSSLLASPGGFTAGRRLPLGGMERRDSWCSSTRARGARCTWVARLFSAFVGTVKALFRLIGWKMLFFFLDPQLSERGM